MGGADPVEVAAPPTAGSAHVHFKDVDAALAARVRAGELGYRDAVARGLYRPLGDGDVDVAGVVGLLQRRRVRRMVRAGAGRRPREGAGGGRGAGARGRSQRELSAEDHAGVIRKLRTGGVALVLALWACGGGKGLLATMAGGERLERLAHELDPAVNGGATR